MKRFLTNYHLQSAIIAIVSITILVLPLFYFGDIIAGDWFFDIVLITPIVIGIVYYLRYKKWPEGL